MFIKIKLIPQVKERFGAITLNQRIESDKKFQIDVDFTMMSDEDQSHGFSIMLQEDYPQFPDMFDPILGFKSNYKGLGVFVYRSENRGKWFIISIQNNGLNSIVSKRDLDNWINQTNSCGFKMMTNARSGIRIKILLDYIYIEKKEDGDQVW